MFRLDKVLFVFAISSLTVGACTSDKGGAGNDAAAGAGGGTGGSSGSGTGGSSGSGTGGSSDSGAGGSSDSGTGGVALPDAASADATNIADASIADASEDGARETANGGADGQSDAGTGTVNWIVPFPALNKGIDAIAVDDTSVYWVTHGANYVYKVAKGGGTPVNLTPNSGSHWMTNESAFHLTTYIAVDATGLYFTANEYNDFIVTLPKAGLPDGGVGKYVVQFPEGKSGVGDLAIVGGIIYSLVYAGPNNGDIWSVPEVGGTPSLVWDHTAVQLVDPITGAPIDSHASTFTTDGQSVIFNNNGTYLARVSAGGGTPEVLAPPSGTDAGTAAGIYSFGPDNQPAISGGFVFTSNGTSLWKVPVGAGSPTLLYSEGCVNTVGTEVETDGVNVYVVLTRAGASCDIALGGLYKLRADGSSAGAPTLVIGDPTSQIHMVHAGHHSLAIDATSVYIEAADGQAIISAPK